ncbi:MAG: hypothetical protein ACTSO2_19500 [Promethearchaeota archaeon]
MGKRVIVLIFAISFLFFNCSTNRVSKELINFNNMDCCGKIEYFDSLWTQIHTFDSTDEVEYYLNKRSNIGYECIPPNERRAAIFFEHMIWDIYKNSGADFIDEKWLFGNLSQSSGYKGNFFIFTGPFETYKMEYKEWKDSCNCK